VPLDTLEPAAQTQDDALPQTEYARGLLETLLRLKHQADRQQEQWDRMFEEQFGASPNKRLKSPSGNSIPASIPARYAGCPTARTPL
jgi:hypothetical protein